jgi:hypothetical protein
MCVHPLVWVMGHSIHSHLPTLISYKGGVEDSRTLLIGLGTMKSALIDLPQLTFVALVVCWEKQNLLSITKIS